MRRVTRYRPSCQMLYVLKTKLSFLVRLVGPVGDPGINEYVIILLVLERSTPKSRNDYDRDPSEIKYSQSWVAPLNKTTFYRIIKVNMDDPNIIMEEYIRLEEEKARRHDFENEFPAIVYNDGQTSKSDSLTGPILNPRHIDEFHLNDETSLSECDEEEQNVLYFNDLFSFNVIYPDDSKSDEDNDDDKIDIKHSSGDLSVKPLPDLIKTDVGAYAHG
ncbi:hypothetical protein Tco_1447269 [Tanacetum coccineum]